MNYRPLYWKVQVLHLNRHTPQGSCTEDFNCYRYGYHSDKAPEIKRILPKGADLWVCVCIDSVKAEGLKLNEADLVLYLIHTLLTRISVQLPWLTWALILTCISLKRKRAMQTWGEHVNSKPGWESNPEPAHCGATSTLKLPKSISKTPTQNRKKSQNKLKY